MTISEDVAEQAEQTLANIAAALAEAGSSFADVVRVRYILPRSEDFPVCWPALQRAFAEVRPAATMIAAGLADPRMKIEIEVTARRLIRSEYIDRPRVFRPAEIAVQRLPKHWLVGRRRPREQRHRRAELHVVRAAEDRMDGATLDGVHRPGALDQP
jgi:hypothetical protein